MQTNLQQHFSKMNDRLAFALHSEKWADCRFLVGSSSNQCSAVGHRFLLATASPVFERMFYGCLPENNNPICIPDVQPNAFKAMLNYIYTDDISISTFDNACDLYYVAKKYMLPHLVEHCTEVLLANLNSMNACRAYEFGKFYEEPRLIKNSMEIIVTNTREVIADPSFMYIKVSTLMEILDQDYLNIDSELDLFFCIRRFADNRGTFNDRNYAAQRTTMDEATMRQAVKKIRFLGMMPLQFSMWPAKSNLLTQNEADAILLKIRSPIFSDYPMPDGFSQLIRSDRPLEP